VHVRALLAHNCPHSETGETTKTTALHVAGECGHFETVRWLLGHGCSLSARNEAGLTPLDVTTDPKVQQLMKKHRTREIWEFV
jgi:ankyrin repeat protein